MKRSHFFYTLSVIFFILCFMTVSCAKKKVEQQKLTETTTETSTRSISSSKTIPQLPTQYQSPSYITTPYQALEGISDVGEENQIRVGATIRSMNGPQPLSVVLKKLVNLKGMTVSWASDVDQSFLVDVDITSQELFFDALNNILRQADYFYEVKDRSIVVKNKSTKVFQLGIPAMGGEYTTSVGGNFLAQRAAAEGTEGTVKIKSAENKFDLWENIEKNLNIILDVAQKERELLGASKSAVDAMSATEKLNVSSAANAKREEQKKIQAEKEEIKKEIISTQRSVDGGFYVIDKSIGTITVTAKPTVMKSVEDYLINLKKQLYQQISLEAKIIEVYLEDRSKIGLDWSKVLKNFNISSTVSFGGSSNGVVYNRSSSSTGFIGKISMNALNFNVLLNALNEQGDSHVLSNPKITVLNGQPAVISVGKDVAYIKEVKRDEDEKGKVTWSVLVDNVVEGVAMGVMASIIDGHKMILHLTPITTDIIGDEIPHVTIGGEVQLGLPNVGVRQMSTMVQVEDGEMLIIGGLIDSIESNSGKFAPGLGSIPIVKYFFGAEEKEVRKRELVILLSPKIM